MTPGRDNTLVGGEDGDERRLQQWRMGWMGEKTGVIKSSNDGKNGKKWQNATKRESGTRNGRNGWKNREKRWKCNKMQQNEPSREKNEKMPQKCEKTRKTAENSGI